MRPILIYIIEFFLCSGLFLLLYRSLIVRKVSYGFCRKYLIIAMLISATIPMLNVPLYPPQTVYLKIPVMTNNESRSDVEEAPATNPAAAKTPAVRTAVNTTAPVQPVTPRLTPEQKWKLFFGILYGIGLVLSLILIISGIVTVIRLKRKSDITVTPDYDLAESDKIKAPFSFMHTVFIGPDYDEKSREHILSHESSHIRHRHSLEKLGMSTLRSLFWFNPFIWIAEKRLEEVQEWQADHDALADGYNLAEYRLSIVKQLFGCNPEMTSGLNSSFTKLRFLQMKQPEIKGGAVIQTLSTMLLAAVMFFSFACTSAGIQPPSNMNTPPADRAIISVERFYDDSFGIKTRTAKLNETVDMFDRVKTGIEIYENYDNKLSPVTIAVNGLLMAKTPDDKCLKWVNQSTVILIGGKKSTLAEFKALKEGDYQEIYFYKPTYSKKARQLFGFVYVTTQPNEIHTYNYTVTIDSPDLEDRNIISPHGMGTFPTLFVYQTDKHNVAMPDAKFVIDGEFVDYQVFRETWKGSNLRKYRLLVYRNEAARKMFGDDVWEVVELNSTRQNLWINFINIDNRIVPTFGSNGTTEATYDEIKSQIARLKESNKAHGDFTLITVKADSFVSDSVYNDFMDNCIDTADPDIVLDLVRFKEIRATDSHGNQYVRLTTE